ncbi:MAG: hypothetical protein ABTD50_15870 [Polyangiaceae bacterium]|jgi:hypothetical protein
MSKRRSRSPRTRPASGPPATTTQAPTAPPDGPGPGPSVPPAAGGLVDEMADLDAGWDDLPSLP